MTVKQWKKRQKKKKTKQNKKKKNKTKPPTQTEWYTENKIVCRKICIMLTEIEMTIMEVSTVDTHETFRLDTRHAISDC